MSTTTRNDRTPGNQLSRRGFIKTNGVAGLAAGAMATGTISPANAKTTAQQKIYYGPRPGIAKLDSNENPFGPSQSALEAMMEATRNGAYYSEDSIPRLKSMIAERHGVTPEHISLSSGSSGVLCSLSVAMTRRGHILAPDLFWDTTAKAGVKQGGEIRRLPKTEDLALDLGAMENSIKRDTAMLHITNPNNPTGRMLDGDKLRAFCVRASKKTTVLVDEAYNEITQDPDFNTMIPLVKAGHNVVVARTFSKLYGLAGMRVGYMISSPENARLLSRYGIGDYTINQAGLAGAIASYNDTKFLAMAKSRIIEAREKLSTALSAQGLTHLPSETNFLFVNLNGLNAEAFRQAMAAQGVWIRGIYRDYSSYSRVSMGLPQDVERYIAALPRVIEQLSAQAA